MRANKKRPPADFNRRSTRGAGRAAVHVLRWFDRRPACGAPAKNVVPTRKPVTCRACKRTHAWGRR